ncbi:MAG: acetate--CoA ligase [Planctomycetes bacterium]|nr:acetate--CoA ligase [Planctomycetota bacterium]MCB9935889.1 acetate--CoA ligase [Planctomycetota bacterium]
MTVRRIEKSQPTLSPNMPAWDDTYRGFRWADARALIDGLPAGGMNIAHEAVDRHIAHGRGEHVAIRWLGKTGETVDLSYAELARRSNRFANVLRKLGLHTGDKVFCLSGRVPELYVAALGTFKAQCVFAPLFSAFGPEPIAQRMRLGGANLLLTTQALLKRKVAGLLDQFPGLKVLLVDGAAEGAVSLRAEMERASDHFTIAPTDPETLALLHFTSGTTGTPKGAMHVHEAVVAHNYSGRVALDLHPDDIYWCTADPGWVTGTSYGIIAPLCNGVTSIVDEAEFDATRWYDILEQQKISVWYTAPTAIRRLMKLGAEPVKAHDLSALRYMASVGEPLNPEAVRWGNEVFGMPFHDNWWQTETGAIMISNYASMDVKPGSMGRPLPGIEAAIVQVEGDTARVIEQPGVQGELAIRRGWPSMFRGYLGQEERYRKCFKGDWYVSGDLAKRDEEGYFWFVGRSDDVIKSAGHLIGPFEVESALVEHPAVNEAGVIGIPEETAGEIVKAFVALKPGFAPSDDLKLEIMAHARKQLGPAVAPRDIEFRDELPKTKSGKIMRRLLKARELGLPEGDLSTLEKSE